MGCVKILIMKKLVDKILRVIFYIPNLLVDAIFKVTDFFYNKNYFIKIFLIYFFSLFAGALALYPLSGCLYLVDLVFNSNLAENFAIFFVAKYKFIKLPLLGSIFVGYLLYWNKYK